jgi:hypothetical protein
MFNLADKNDPKDATVILQLLKHGLVQHYHDPLLRWSSRSPGTGEDLSPGDDGAQTPRR